MKKINISKEYYVATVCKTIKSGFFGSLFDGTVLSAIQVGITHMHEKESKMHIKNIKK